MAAGRVREKWKREPWPGVLCRHLQSATHQAHEVGTDGEPEAGAAEASRGGRVRLGETIKYTAERGRLDSDTGIAHLKLEDGGVGRGIG